MTRDAESKPEYGPATQRWRELIIFLILAFGIWPIVAVGVVGGYGFIIWMIQLIFGPPGPPGGLGH